MTEAEWRTCTDPEKTLGFLRGKASDRKLRLLACACCRGTWRLLTDERSRQASSRLPMDARPIPNGLFTANTVLSFSTVTSTLSSFRRVVILNLASGLPGAWASPDPSCSR
jgi:hypothetical protein